jgi:hypothetical protein
MDSYREYPSEFDSPATSQASAPDDVCAAIGTDERRMHVRAYNYWVSLLDGRDYPSIEDLEPADVTDFAPHSVLLDFTSGPDNPATPYLGTAIRQECGLDSEIRTIDDVPARSLLSRLTDHYMQIIANRAPVGFEAEFVNQRGDNICYRGILMPFSSDGDTIDFIYGVINWKTVAEPAAAKIIAPALPPLNLEEDDIAEAPLANLPLEAPEEWLPDAIESEPVAHLSWEDGPLAEPAEAELLPEILEVVLDEDAGLADRLWAARETAEVVKSADGRSRVALYRALALAYDFAIAAKRVPDEYAELLEDSGVKAQARAPMTPIVKLVFGIDYDKTRLTEFASALSYAQREQVDFGDFQPFIERQAGGLKALVAAERQARRGETEPKPDTRGEQARARLRDAEPQSLDTLAASEEFAVAVVRRRSDGGYEVVGIVADEALTEKAIRRAANC